jgi:cation:H+ antiporter
MLLNIIMLLLGIGGLYLGGEWLVKSAARLASSFGASVLVIGLTIVAWATSAPELIVTVQAAVQGSTEMALGNIIGSNIVNIGLCLGIMGLMFPVKISWQLIQRELPLMIGAALLAFVLSADGVLSRLDGFILFSGFLGFSALVYYLVQQESKKVTTSLEEYEEAQGFIDSNINRKQEFWKLTAGLFFLIVGATLTVEGGTAIARSFGISEFLIGLTLVAFGTSLPEFTASLIAASRRQTDIAIGNIIGSNIANILGILGITAMIAEVPVSPNSLQVQIPVLLGFSVLTLLLGLSRVIERWKAAVLLLAYFAFIGFSFMG